MAAAMRLFWDFVGFFYGFLVVLARDSQWLFKPLPAGV